MSRRRLDAVAGLAIAVCALASGQQRESKPCSGILRWANGEAIPGAVVRLDSPTTHVSSKTSDDGSFTFVALIAGDYTIAVDYRGATITYPQPQRLPGGGPLILQLADGALSLADAAKTLSARAVSELPLNKRDFSQLLLLAAGTMTDTNGASNFTQQFAVNGQRGVTAVFAMDGADSTDPEMGGATFTNFNVDAVQEIRSKSGWMPAEIGRGAAGFTDIVTRSGGNALHGSVFEFLRNAALDARNFFDRRSLANPGRIPPFVRNEFGFTGGGPLLLPHIYDGRNRTFFFAEYQGFRQVLGTTQVLSVPTAQEREGRDTTAFPGDTLLVPVDPRIAPLLARYPLPNDPGGSFGPRTYATSSKVTTNSDQFSVRIDHRISDKSQLFGRFTMDNIAGPTTNPSQTAIDRSFAVEFIDRERNAVITFIRTPSAKLTLESSVSFTRTTPSFPTPNHTDPALTFGDGLYEPFNNAAGSVTASYGNLFQARQNVTWVRGAHTIKAGAEVRANRDTTLYGMNPNGQYQFGGGAAYSPVAIRSLSGLHDIHPGDPLPDALTGLLTASAFTYTLAVAPPNFAQGDHIGDSGIRREAYNAYVQDSWRISDRLLLNVGLRYEVNTPIRESAKRTSRPVLASEPGVLPGSRLVIDPDPPYTTNKNGWGPRVSIEWRPFSNTMLHAGGAIVTLLTNLWQDNALTGSTPFVVYPRLTAAPGEFIRFGTTITPQQLPVAYAVNGGAIFASGDSKRVPANTVMDVQRYEQDLAALSPDQRVTPLWVSGISPDFRDGYIGMWTAGLEQKIDGVTLDADYVGTAGIRLPGMNYANGYPGADPAFAPYTQFDSAGRVIGGYGLATIIAARSHSTYHALQVSARKDLTASGLGFQASYTFSKSLDDTSSVFGAQTTPQDPFNWRADRGPSSFDITHAFTFSLFQDLHLDRFKPLGPLGTTATRGWQLLGIGTALTGLPFTVNSGIQQTGVGSMGADRPDEIAAPEFSTSRTVREDYFGRGDRNATFFSIPLHVAGGTGPNEGRFGTLGRNVFRGPGFRNLDIAVIKDTPLLRRGAGEAMTLQFRAEFFNVFNIVNFGLPSNIVLGPGFGVIARTAGTSRQLQFSLKLMY